jgi:hypothetical protein
MSEYNEACETKQPHRSSAVLTKLSTALALTIHLFTQVASASHQLTDRPILRPHNIFIKAVGA